MRKEIMFGALLSLLPACSLAERVVDWQGDAPQVTQPKVIIANNASAWEQIWQQVGQKALTPLPDNYAAVAVFAGQKRSGGYRVEFVSVTSDQHQTIVSYRIRKPGFDEMVTQALTAPYAIRLVPRGDKPIVAQEVR